MRYLKMFILNGHFNLLCIFNEMLHAVFLFLFKNIKIKNVKIFKNRNKKYIKRKASWKYLTK